MEELARKLNLDPNEASDWSQMTTAQVMENNGHGLLSRYGGSLRKALMDTFVDMPFDFNGNCFVPLPPPLQNRNFSLSDWVA